jgi:tetratricopeptide (TPR) repeat protein
VLKIAFLASLITLQAVCANAHNVCEVERVDIQKAKESIETILLSEPSNVVCMLQLANIHLKQGKIAKGFELLVDAYSMDPHTVQKSQIADILPFAMKVNTLKRQALRTNDKEIWQKLGDGYFEMGIFNEATEMYKNSLQADENQPETRLKLSLALQKNCQTYTAIEELQKILARDQNHIYANYYLGKILLYDVKNEADAKRYFTTAKNRLVTQKDAFAYVEYTNLLSDIRKELRE